MRLLQPFSPSTGHITRQSLSASFFKHLFLVGGREQHVHEFNHSCTLRRVGTIRNVE